MQARQLPVPTALSIRSACTSSTRASSTPLKDIAAPKLSLIIALAPSVRIVRTVCSNGIHLR